MPFIPHTSEDINQMLATIGINDVRALFDEIPAGIQIPVVNLPDGLSELAITRLMKECAKADKPLSVFAGAGAYEHHIPAAVWQLVGRGEFYSAYTPYQAEASQGTLQLLYEYQSMMCALMAMDCSNASLYDGATACAEAALLAVRAHPSRPKKILVPRTLNPRYREVLASVLPLQGIEVVTCDYDRKSGKMGLDWIAQHKDHATALMIPSPNYFGVIEDVDAVTDAAHSANIAVIGVVNPLAMTLLKPPGEWGTGEQRGADIAVGEGQPLGIPLSSGGPYFGFMTCKQALVRQMPGRIIGQTTDVDGQIGYTLTLQTREQHIRRAKATSNICTNQGLMVTAATIHMAIMGGQGLYAQATRSHENMGRLKALIAIEKWAISPLFNGEFFHELVLQVPKSAQALIEQGVQRGILLGVSLKEDYPEWGEALLVCVTDTKTTDDLSAWVSTMSEVILN